MRIAHLRRLQRQHFNVVKQYLLLAANVRLLNMECRYGINILGILSLQLQGMSM